MVEQRLQAFWNHLIIQNRWEGGSFYRKSNTAAERNAEERGSIRKRNLPNDLPEANRSQRKSFDEEECFDEHGESFHKEVEEERNREREEREKNPVAKLYENNY